MDARIYLHLDGEFLKKNKEVAHQAAIKAVGEEDAKEDLVFEQIEGSLEHFEADTAAGSVDLGISTPLGYISVEWYPTTEELADIVNLAIKKMNKLKTAFEAMKNY